MPEAIRNYTEWSYQSEQWIFGNESTGLCRCKPLIDEWVNIPMAAGVESLNVAMSATLVAFENVRRQLT